MTRRTLAALQLTSAAVVVATLAYVGGGRYPLPVDLIVYATAALATATAVRLAADGAVNRRQEAPDPADRPAVQTRAEALQEAADWVITARPEIDPGARTVTPAAVQREAFMRSGLEVTNSEARTILADRLRFRGYPTDQLTDPKGES